MLFLILGKDEVGDNQENVMPLLSWLKGFVSVSTCSVQLGCSPVVMECSSRCSALNPARLPLKKVLKSTLKWNGIIEVVLEGAERNGGRSRGIIGRLPQNRFTNMALSK